MRRQQQARRINAELLPVITGIMTHAQGVIAAKAALEMLGLPGGGALRPPLAVATPAERDLIAADLRAAGVLE